MWTLPKQFVSVEEYLAIERAAEIKSEYHAGQMFAMSGGSANHSRIAVNLLVSLQGALLGRPCETFNSDLRVRAGRSYVYPDVSVVCGKPRLADDWSDILENPIAVFEVLSRSTEAYDRGRKFAVYRQIDSLRTYVLLSQSTAQVEVFAKRGDEWVLTAVSGLEATLELAVLDVRIPMAELYRGVELEVDEGQ